ncbi:hypothetical protein RY831_30105 [Noviherbaspirillum sp. CPCC 100848]|uniref:Uncharacterized protein n=1 Tax=Noviherbaspirillum album TaxID=3080276 RepID=A0ABU6JIA0_9BURK|nr:hypothetical protein [Noviherbaspirillum sp. CPCC 100848]MEC4723401.1 hypothetical protein [Noviherbaspirillum sp. CPCC 100848]
MRTPLIDQAYASNLDVVAPMKVWAERRLGIRERDVMLDSEWRNSVLTRATLFKAAPIDVFTGDLVGLLEPFFYTLQITKEMQNV